MKEILEVERGPYLYLFAWSWRAMGHGAWGKGFGRWQALILIYAHKLRRVQSVGDLA